MAGLFDEINPIQRVATNQYGMSVNSITRGSLISFNYPISYASDPSVIHDPYPMVIITDIWPKHIRGVNIHYLTFPYVKNLLTNFGGNQSFTYQSIKMDGFISDAFRMYSRMGIRNPKRLDNEWLIQMLSSVRSFSPGELEKMRAMIQNQIRQRLQIKANELNSINQLGNNVNQPLNRPVQPITPIAKPSVTPTTPIVGQNKSGPSTDMNLQPQ